MWRRGPVSVAILFVAACAGMRPDLATVEGVWESSGGFDYSRMDIAADGRIVWLSGGCLDEFHGESRGTLRDGKLVLSTPVRDYAAGEVTVFHHFRDKEREYLVAEQQMQFVREDAEPFGCDVWWGLRRRIPKAALRERIATCKDNDERVSLLGEWAEWPVDMDGVGYLAGIAREDPSGAVRARAIFALERAGMDDNDNVTDQAVRAAAEVVVRQLTPEEEGGCTPDAAASGTQDPSR